MHGNRRRRTRLDAMDARSRRRTIRRILFNAPNVGRQFIV